PNVKSIKAEIVADKLPNEIYDNTAVNKLKEYIKVVATYDDADGSTKELAANEYVLTGTLSAGKISYFTVTYGGKTTSVAFTNVVKFEVQSISAVSTQSGAIYSSASTDDIKGSVMVTGVYNDNTDSVLTPDQFDIVLPEGGLSSTNNTVTIKCGDKTTTVSLTITDVISTGIEVEYTDSGNITVDSTAQDLLSGIKITLNYNDGTSEEITPTADMISGDMDSIGNKTITVTYTDPEDSSVTHSDTFTVSIGKGTFDMSNVKFEDKTVTYNGEEHNIEISGDLPEGVSVSYEGNGQIEVNEEGYIVTAKFTHSNPNYNEIPDKTAKLIISNKPVYDMSGVTFEDVTDV
ncbi:MAG: hypothetical protein K2I79_04285, partial [Clostridia bacterium]|nr:hypothetical protein [Clostridia bacterium]